MVGFSNLAYYFQMYGVMDFLLPFLLVFTIVFAVLQKTKIVGEGKKNFNVIVALVLALMFVVPHIIGTYPLGYDPVAVAVASMMLLLLMGIFGTDFSKKAAPFIAFGAIGFVAYIFGSALNVWNGPSYFFNWWSPQTTELMIIILVFGVIIWFITKEDDKKSKGDSFMKSLGEFFEKK